MKSFNKKYFYPMFILLFIFIFNMNSAFAGSWSVSKNKVKSKVKVKQGSTTKSFKITSNGDVDLKIIAPPVNYIRVAPQKIRYSSGKHKTDVKVVFFCEKQYVSSDGFKGEIKVIDNKSGKVKSVIYHMKCKY